MRVPRNPRLLTALCIMFCGLTATAGPALSAPPASAPPAASSPAASAPIPDYGTRDNAPLATGDSAPDPAAQAGRAVAALVIVLAAVVGAVYALKRFGWVTSGPDGVSRIKITGLGRLSPPIDSRVTVESSQALPGGAMLHVVTVAGRTLLLAATPQTVTAVAEWPADAQTTEEAAAFEEYLARADASDSGIAAANARLRSLLNRPQPPKDMP